MSVYAKYFVDLAKLEQDYQDNVSDALWDAANKRSQLEANYREKELKEEIKYQDFMQKLREGFVLDLEDALRETGCPTDFAPYS